MSKKQNDDKRRTQVKALPTAEKTLSKAEQKKLKGGNWLMTPAGSAKQEVASMIPGIGTAVG